MLQQMMQLMSKLNASVEKMVASQEEIRNTFPAQPERNPRDQNPGSSSREQKHKQEKAVTILWSGKTLERDYPPLTPIVKDEEEDGEVEKVGKKKILEKEWLRKKKQRVK